MESNENINELLEYFDLDNKNIRLKFIECLGMLTLMSHWMRGILDLLVRENYINLNEVDQNNWNRVIRNLSIYEKFLWEIVPPRAMLLNLRHFRETGRLEKDYQLLMESDTHGRIPEDLDEENIEEIKALLGKMVSKQGDLPNEGYGHGLSLLNM